MELKPKFYLIKPNLPNIISCSHNPQFYESIIEYVLGINLL